MNDMPAAAEATIIMLRRDLALQISRAVLRLDTTQVLAAKRLKIPQPTLSNIMNSQTDNLSIELLVRVAVRAGLSLTLLTGEVPEEAGAFVSNLGRQSVAAAKSLLAEQARRSVRDSHRRLTPSQRLEAFLEHNQLLEELRVASRHARKLRADKTHRPQ